jgi:hypothetical protein
MIFHLAITGLVM